MKVANSLLEGSVDFDIMDLEEVIINIKSKVISPNSPQPEDFLLSRYSDNIILGRGSC